MSALTFLNDTLFTAQFVAMRGQLPLNRLPLTNPGATLQLPSDDSYQVIATMPDGGNTYESSPATINGPTAFLAQITDNVEKRTFDLEIKVDKNTSAEMVFQSTAINPVTFDISKHGKRLKRVVVQNSFEVETLTLGNDYTIYAVINGITTRSMRTSNPNAVITALADDGHFTLSVR